MLTKFLNYIVQYIPESNRWERVWKIAQIDLKKRYYNDKLGVFWALLDPIFQVAIYYLVFTFLIQRNQEGGSENFALFLFSVIIFWKFFAETFKTGMKILQSKLYLIKSTQIDKLDIFISLGISNTLGLLFNILAYIIAALLSGIPFSTHLFTFPLLILIYLLIAIGSAMIIAVAHIYSKDINHIVQLFLQLGFWTSGIFFPSEKVKEFWEPLYYLNPFLGLFENTRCVLLYDKSLNYEILMVNLITAIVIFACGIFLIRTRSHLLLENI